MAIVGYGFFGGGLIGMIVGIASFIGVWNSDETN